ncbi:MAG: aminoglycoside phosphotransferase [Alphaproteobacteria bacterium]|nr:MAG: aminoglycoside phosphotransferase [Alphaproteobacteria bacterium]
MTTDGVLTNSDELQAGIDEAFVQGVIEGVAMPATLIETQLNRVFLCHDRAYKLKRAVRLPFVDFRSLDQRRKACEAEFDINRALGSPFYLQVTPLRRNRHGFTLSGDGDVVDCVVVMRRFETGARLDELAERGALDVETTEATGAMIAQMHCSALPNYLLGHASDYRQVIRTLRRTEEMAAAADDLSVASDDLYTRLDAELARLDPLIEERREAGKVRRVHGDLHLGNLCVHDGVPVAFDALEFDDRLATSDVLYDVAFLLMDLESRGMKRHANAAMNRYWDDARESECGLALLPFFMALRAAVRMVVAVQAHALSDAKRYRELAMSLLKHQKPVAVAIGGLSGSGKSSLAKAIGPFLPGPAGARILRSDVLRKRAAGIELTKAADECWYNKYRRAEIYRDLVAKAALARRVGTSVVADATFQLADARETLDFGLPNCCKIWLEAPLDMRLARVSARRGDASDADAAVVARQHVPDRPGADWRRMDGGLPIAQLVDRLLEDLQ